MADTEQTHPGARRAQPRGTAHAFRAAVEARDVAAITALLADDVVFRSPVAHKPYPGKAITASILAEVVEFVADFRYRTDIGAPDARDHALVFEARVGDKQLTGCDFLHVGDDGLVDELMVMVRPLSGATALAEEMGARFDRIAARAAGH